MKENRFFKFFQKLIRSFNNRKRFCAAFSAALTVVSVSFALPLRVYAAVENLSASAAIAYEPVTGTVLYEKNADERMLVASTTKIMTALVVLENCALEETVSVTMQDAAVEGSSMYLKPGEHYTVEDLLYGLLLASGNDAAPARRIWRS